VKSPLLQSLFDEEERRPLTVSELNDRVRGTLERNFASVWIEAEIVNFVEAHSGHWYFTLHDSDSQLRAACYARSNMRIRFRPFDGLQVRVRGKLSVYRPKGEYQILVESLEPVGEGALKVAFEQIKAKLEREGLFAEELKRQLPVLPRRVGVITSPTGAAIHDILNVISRRTRTVNVTLIPTRVQGETAGEEIEAAINFANLYNLTAAEKIDVLIVGRGGGSSEDLWAFNEERVARAIRASLIPVISAVGHEIDFTIADFVSDRRAPTPSAAAEIVAESEEALRYYIQQKTQDLFQIAQFRMLQAQNRLQEAALSPVFIEFPQKIRDLGYEVEDCTDRLQNGFTALLEAFRGRIDSLGGRMSPVRLATKLHGNRTRLALLSQRSATAAKNRLDAADEKMKIAFASLDALSPLAVLRRGFSITENQAGEILRRSVQTHIGDKLNIRLGEGSLKAEVVSLEN
jgi:exodeoxyribonuclease VII large subunit